MTKLPLFCLLAAVAVSCAKEAVTVEYENFNLIHQDGPTLGYSPDSGVGILREGRLAFKDLNRNGSLDIYEDWRRSIEDRVEDLANQLSKEEIAGLMLYLSLIHI